MFAILRLLAAFIAVVLTSLKSLLKDAKRRGNVAQNVAAMISLMLARCRMASRRLGRSGVAASRAW
jgi:hypothetical protein